MYRDCLLVIDPQNIFADPTSPWAAPDFQAAWENIASIAPLFTKPIFTKWLPTAPRVGAWKDYYATWPFADTAADDPQYAYTDAADELALQVRASHMATHQFGKWNQRLIHLLPPSPRLVLTGVATDCCIISTALAAVDAGVPVVIVTDAVAGSTPENQRAALQVLEQYAPMITFTTTSEIKAATNQISMEDL